MMRRRRWPVSYTHLDVYKRQLGASMWGLLWWAQWVPPESELAELLTRNPQEYALSFGHIFDLDVYKRQG